MVKLNECVLDGDTVFGYPVTFDRPEEAWTTSLEEGHVPRAVFDLYCAAKYFSIGTAPKVLRDSEGLLFPYLKVLVNAIRESFGDVAPLLEQLRVAEASHISHYKEKRGESWDPAAGQKSRRTFKYLLVEMAGVLDQTAEVVALLVQGDVPIRLGRAQFVWLVEAAKRYKRAGGIVSPPIAQLEKLYEAVQGEVVGTGTEVDWFELFQLYRNKLAHIGNYMFPMVGLLEKGTETFHAFLPNRWPVLMERHITVGRRGTPIDFEKLFRAEYIHQDLIEYAEGLVVRVRSVVQNLFGVLLETYRLFADFEPDERASAALKDEGQSWRFEYFDE